MSFVPNFPPSLLRKVKEDDSDGKKKTKEDFKKMKELEEARKLAVMPAMKDEEGRDINPHIPQYIMQAPWYYGALHPTLRHQRIQDESKREDASGMMKGSSALNQWYLKGKLCEGKRSIKYRDGACQNCGAMTHQKKECLERPRKVGAKFTGLEIAADELPQVDISLGFDAKRDRWNGYDPQEHQHLVEEGQRLDEARKIVRAKKLEEKLTAVAEDKNGQEEPAASAAAPTLEDDADFGGEDEDRYGDEMAMPGQKFDSKQRQSIRNLRIREDTAKYLFNLDPNSAYYDPKTRAMRENPFENTGKPESEVPFAGDNFVRYDGDAPKMVEGQVFAWEMHNKLGLDIHLQADPTRLEYLTKKISTAKTQVQSEVRDEILERYGGREHFEVPSRDLLLGQWESYAEYSPTGRILKGAEKPSVQSRYEEDVYINNHKSTWGSYWFNGQWGYKCCLSLIKESYCTGAAGKSLTLPEVPTGKEAANFVAPPPMPSCASDDESSSQQPAPQHKLPAAPKHGQHSALPDGKYQPATEITAAGCSETSPICCVADESEPEAVVLNELTKQEREAELHRSSQRRQELRAKRAKKRKQRREKKHSKATHRHKKRKRSSSNSSSSSTSSSSSSEEEVDETAKREAKIAIAVAKEKARLEKVDRLMQLEESARPYNSMTEVKAPTEEEMEAYYRTRVNHDDPMSAFL